MDTQLHVAYLCHVSDSINYNLKSKSLTMKIVKFFQRRLKKKNFNNLIYLKNHFKKGFSSSWYKETNGILHNKIK